MQRAKQTAPAAATSTPAAAETLPVLLLDQQGVVLSANAAARRFWQAGDYELIGEPFVRLFQFEVVSDDPEFLEAQWEVLTGAARRSPLALEALPREGAPAQVSLKLEKLTGPLNAYFATLTPAALPDPAPASPPSAPAATTPLQQCVGLLASDQGLAVFDLNFQTNTAHYSPAWKKLLGYVDAELPNTYKTWQQLIHPEDTRAAPDQLGTHAPTPGQHAFSVEYRMKHRLGHWVWMHCTGLRIVSPERKLQRVVGLHLDITERKEQEEAMLVSDEWLQAMGSERPLAAFSIDFTQKTCWLSPAWARLTGHPDGALASSIGTLCQLLPPANTPEGLAAWFATRGIIGENSFVETTQLRHRDGHWLPVLIGARRYYSRKQDLQRIVGYCCPLPALIDTDAASGTPVQTWVDALLSNLAEAVIVTDVLGNIRDLNATAIRLLQTRMAQALGHPLKEVFRLIDRTTGKPLAEDPCTQAIHADAPLPLCDAHALRPPQPHGKPVPIVWTARTYSKKGDQPEGTIIIFRDPDELSLTPDELIKVNRFESLGLLAGSIAHDFNNLLTTIMGGVSLANDNRDYSRLRDSENACLAAKALSKQLLAFAKGGSGNRQTLAPAEILDDAIRIAAAGSATVFDRQLAEKIPPIRVDRAQILQVFQNLIVNAIQAMPPPPHRPQIELRVQTITLSDRTPADLPCGTYVQFDVSDNANGIPPENLQKIWDPFFTTKRHGTGLGLATVRNIVQKHGGFITVESQVGHGTQFTVLLPVADGPADVQARRQATLRYGTGRILVMDDDPNICALTGNMLESLFYKFDIARNGEEAIKLYRSYLSIGRPYDAVLMDLTIIGGMGGEEAFLALKDIDPEVVAIVSTGYDNDDVIQRYLNLGFSGYVTKPYRVTDLAKSLKDVLGERPVE